MRWQQGLQRAIGRIPRVERWRLTAGITGNLLYSNHLGSSPHVIKPLSQDRWAPVLCVLLLLGSPLGSLPDAKSAEPAPMETHWLTTKDGVKLFVRFYPGSEGRKSAPIIILHGWDGPRGPGSGADVTSLAEHLQGRGHAVAVPDLRGHGQSRKRRRDDGSVETLDRKRFRLPQVRAMLWDLEAIKSFLIAEHEKGKLNIELTGVIAFDAITVVALHWIRYDWNAPTLPGLKQGQDVKAFALVSPLGAFRGLTIAAVMADAKVRALSAAIAYGQKDRPSAQVAQQIYRVMRRAHSTADETGEDTLGDLVLIQLPTSLRGTKLLGPAELGLEKRLGEFFQRRLTDRGVEFPWRPRRRR